MKLTSFLVPVVLAINCWAAVDALQEGNQDQVTQLLIQLQNESWTVREEAVRQVRALPDEMKTDHLKMALIALLEKETAFLKTHIPGKSKGYGEDYGEYYSELLASVMELKDKRAIRPLVYSSYNPYSEVTRFIADYGEAALGPVLERLQNRLEAPERQSVMSILNVIVENHLKGKISLSSQSLATIKEALVGLLHNSFQLTKLEAVKGLGMLGTRELAPLMKGVLAQSLQGQAPGERLTGLEVIEKFPPDMAAAVPLEEIKVLSLTDAHTIIKDVRGQKQEVYPIREKAKQLVAKFGRVEKR